MMPWSGWTVAAMAGAVDKHNLGDFAMSGRLWEDMSAHPWIRDALAVRAEVFTTCPIQFTPAGRTDEERRRSSRCRDFTREVFADVLPLSTLKDLQRVELGMGTGAFSMDWERRIDGADTWWLPRIKPWEPTLLGYRQLLDPLSVDGGAYVATTMSHGLVRVDHGGGRWGLVSRRSGRPFLAGLVRTLAEAFVGDGYNFRDNQTHQDRYGRGIIQIDYPRGMRQEEVMGAASSVAEGGGGGVVLAPKGPDGTGIDYKLWTMDGAGYQTFDATEKRILRRILISLLRQDMTTAGNTGIAENDPRAMSLWKCREDDAATYGDARCGVRWENVGGVRHSVPVWEPCHGVLREAIWRWIAYFNFGDFDLAPYVWWDATPPEDHEKRLDAAVKRGQQRAATIASLATAAKTMKDLGVKHDLYHLAEQCGVSFFPVADEAGEGEVDPDSVPDPPPSAEAPGAADADHDDAVPGADLPVG